MVITTEQIRTDLYQAYYDARANKRGTLAQLNFEVFLEHNLEELYLLLANRTYRVLPPYCFITFDPVQREVYASQFRDRIVQHMLFNYLSPFYEPLFIYDTYSCRKGKGTLFGVERYQHHLRSVTNNFTRKAWVLYLDLSGFFMSIDRQLVKEIIMDRINQRYDRKSPDGRKWNQILDADFIAYLLHCMLDHNPSEGCIYIGNPHDWEGLPKRKCMRYSPEGRGIVIGDLDSQLFSNILLDVYDQWVKRTVKLKHYGHYVDDMYHMHESKEFLLETQERLEEFLEMKLHLKVNQDKWRLLSARAASQYLGAYIRPYYSVPRQRTIDKFWYVTQEMERELLIPDPSMDKILHIRSRINSYLGILSHYKSFNLRKSFMNRPAFYRYFIYDKGFRKAILRPEYGGKLAHKDFYVPFNDEDMLFYLDSPLRQAYPPISNETQNALKHRFF